MIEFFRKSLQAAAADGFGVNKTDASAGHFVVEKSTWDRVVTDDVERNRAALYDALPPEGRAYNARKPDGWKFSEPAAFYRSLSIAAVFGSGEATFTVSVKVCNQVKGHEAQCGPARAFLLGPEVEDLEQLFQTISGEKEQPLPATPSSEI